MANINKAKFIGTCDRVRRSEEGEANWQQMMARRKLFKLDMMMDRVDFSGVLDDGETVNQWLSDILKYDPSFECYLSQWGAQECYFIQVAGFEYIFVNN